MTLLIRSIATLVGLAGAALLALAVTSTGVTQPIRDHSGSVVPNSVAESTMIELGGVEQFALIRGRNIANPVLLLLHGGPGDAQTPLSRYFNAGLEDQFVVVNWDQRGAGRSFDPNADVAALTEEQLIADAHQLTRTLRERFGGRKLILAGHSWGSYLGIRLASRYPDDYAAYVGIGQVANQSVSEARSYEFVLQRAEGEGRSAALEALREIGPPDDGGHYRGGLRGLLVQRKWVREFGGAAHGRGNLGTLLMLGWPLISSGEYRLRDKLRYLTAELRSMQALEDDILAANLMSEIRRLDLPFFVFQGRHDQQTVTSLTREYYEMIEAPHKELIEFDEAAHLVPYEQPERFLSAMVQRVRPWSAKSRPARADRANQRESHHQPKKVASE